MSTTPHDPRPDRILLAVLGGLLLLVAGTAFVRDARPEWKRDQERARDLVASSLGAARAERLPRGLRQVWIQPLSRTDRCVACHVGIEEGRDLASLPEPARSHPRPELLAAHPVERFGCTLCHGGQGAATTAEAAHGDVEFWDEPLLTGARAAPYGLRANELLEVRCNGCHRRQETVEGMPLMNEAKALWKAKRCASCHTVDGMGGRVGPELTWEGDEPADRRHFPAGYGGIRSVLGWHVAHIKSPTSMVPTSEMKQFEMTDREVLSLALLVMSWRRLDLPPAWVPGAAPRKK